MSDDDHASIEEQSLQSQLHIGLPVFILRCEWKALGDVGIMYSKHQ